jgi:ParB family chromosome partitioning protein
MSQQSHFAGRTAQQEPATGQPAQGRPQGTATPPPPETPPQQTTGVLVGEVRLINPALIRVTQHPNRAPDAYTNEEFDVFRDVIQHANGNTQPITVRRTADATDGYEYELIAGHRRHRACLDLGLDVLAVIEVDCGDDSAYLLRLRENSGRVDLSPWELGCQVLDGIKHRHLRSIRHAGLVTGRDPSDLAKAVQLAELPPSVIGAFASPTELQYRHAKPLTDALKTRETAVISEAKRIAALPERPVTAEVVNLLISAAGGGVGRSHTPPQDRPLTADGQRVGRIKASRGKQTVVEIEVALADKERETLAKAIERLVAKKLAKPALAATDPTEAKP